MYHFALLKGQAKIYRGNRGKTGKMAQTKRRTTTKRKAAPRKRKPQPKADMSANWSILLFGLAILVAAMTYVPGASAWAWLRMNVLFGVFGVSTYLLAPALVYLAILVAMGRPARLKMAFGALVMAFACGVFLVFSKTDMTGLAFADGMKALHESGKAAWGLGGGALSAVFGWSLLAAFGRPGANIVLVVLLVVSVMFFTGCTPLDIYRYFTRGARTAKEKGAELSAQMARQREEREAQREAARAAAQDAARKKALFAEAEKEVRGYDAQKYEVHTFNAQPGRRRSSIDIDLGDAAMAQNTVKHEEKPEIGPGGTFGMYPNPYAGSMPHGEVLDAPFVDKLGLDTQVPAAPAAPHMQRSAQVPGQTAAQPVAPAQPADELGRLVHKAAGAPQPEQAQPAPPPAAEDTGYAYPPLSLFQKQKAADEGDIEAELRHNADLLVSTLESFGVKTRMLDISRGPSVTRYELQPQAGVKISRITGLADDIALNLATAGVRIEAPIPGKAAVGIEIPNKTRTMVTLRSLLESPEFATSKAPLTFALGKDIAGKCQVGNLAKMPHLLIAGTTGSGKSVCTNSIIMSFLYRCSPEKLRLILIDPKMVEFAQYNGIPHLLMPVVTEPRKAAGALGSAVAEMERRYKLLAENGVPNIEEYNALAEMDESIEKMPYIVIVIDELADLMMVAGKEVEDYICRIAQKARAAGMHLIVATQRPSVDVITGLIKANIPSRIGLSVMSQIDSRTILDTGGAEKLLGNGDMLYMPVGVNKPVRVQGTFVRSAEIRAVIDFIKKHSAADYDEEMIAHMDKLAAAEKGGAADGGEGSDARDPMFSQAAEVVIEAGQASTSLLQRRCKLGYARAARIIDELEQAHIVGPYEGSKPRQVLITRQQWLEMEQNGTAGPAPEPVPDELM